jgi:hypothetical protein
VKKIIFLTAFLFGLIFFISPKKVSASPQCDAQKGTCLTACNTSSKDLGTLDCPIQSNGKGNGIQTTCCIYQPPAVQTGGVTSTTPPDIHGGCGDTSISTAIGCIPVFDQTSFLSFILKWAVGIGGGIAFLLMVYAGFMIMTAAGNPDRLKAGQELLTSAIGGLILLIFSVFILKFIGVDILGLCNFGFGTCS